MNVELPDGTVLQDIPEGTTRADLMAKLSRNGYDVSKLGPAETEDYGNEGRRSAQTPAAAAQKPDGPNRKLFKALLGDELGTVAGDIGAGLGKSVVGGLNTVEDLMPPTALIKLARGGKRNPINESLTKYANESYEEAGPVAGVTKVLGDIALTSGPGAAAGTAVGNLVRGQAPGVARKVAGNAAELATGGAVGGALVDPEEGETRAGNASQGAAFGLGAGTVLAGGTKLAKSGYNLAKDRGVDKALARAGTFFEKTLGKGRMAAVTNNLDQPRGLPMSTAAAGGRDELMSLERLSRARANPVDNARWGALDSRTKQKAWERLGEATGDDLARMQPQAEEAKAILTEAQQALNGIPLTTGARTSLGDELMSLKNRPEFENNTKAQRFVNDFVGNLMDDTSKRTVGGLAHFETDLAADKSLSPKAREAIWGVIRKHIDANGGGAWSEAYNLRSAALRGLDESKASNAILSDFQDIYGGPKGKSVSGSPELGSTRLQTSLNRRGTDATDELNPVDRLNPETRQQIQSIVDDLRKAEAPQGTKGGKAPVNNPWGSLPLDARGSPGGVNYMIADLLRKAGRIMYGKRVDATQRAADMALRSPQGWNRMLEQLDKSKELSASDAAMIARILRASGPSAGAVTVED